MKNYILFLIMVMLSFAAYAQVEVAEPETIKWGALILKLAVATLAGAALTAINHIVAWTFDVKLWLADTLKPSLIAFGIALVLGLIDAYVGVLDNMLESLFNIQTSVNDTGTLVTAAFILVPIIKGYFKREATKAKVAAKTTLEVSK